MSEQLRDGYDLLSLFRKLKHQHCCTVINHLSDKGVELLCELVHHLIQGHFPLHRRTKKRLRTKIHHHLKEFRTLTRAAKKAQDIERKRKVLKRGGIIGTLATIASALIPIITSLLPK